MSETKRLRVYCHFAWYDMWVGLFWARATRTLYVCPLPCLVIVFSFPFKRGTVEEQGKEAT